MMGRPVITLTAQDQNSILEMKSPADKDKSGTGKCHRKWPDYQPE
jgi:hypothetical protein